jgi:hypothetical protein
VIRLVRLRFARQAMMEGEKEMPKRMLITRPDGRNGGTRPTFRRTEDVES